MPELNPRDRLQPFLFDRLIDDQSEQTKESREKYVYSPRQLRASILRDLGWLLNTPAPVAEEGIGEFPQVSHSVVNYGIPDLTGTTASGVQDNMLERAIMKAIQSFEPRMEKHGLHVKILPRDEKLAPNSILLEIRGEVVLSQVPEALYIKTEVDLESGLISIKDRTNG